MAATKEGARRLVNTQGTSDVPTYFSSDGTFGHGGAPPHVMFLAQCLHKNNLHYLRLADNAWLFGNKDSLFQLVLDGYKSIFGPDALDLERDARALLRNADDVVVLVKDLGNGSVLVLGLYSLRQCCSEHGQVQGTGPIEYHYLEAVMAGEELQKRRIGVGTLLLMGARAFNDKPRQLILIVTPRHQVMNQVTRKIETKWNDELHVVLKFYNKNGFRSLADESNDNVMQDITKASQAFASSRSNMSNS